jgi:hypothetical protein
MPDDKSLIEQRVTKRAIILKENAVSGFDGLLIAFAACRVSFEGRVSSRQSKS